MYFRVLLFLDCFWGCIEYRNMCPNIRTCKVWRQYSSRVPLPTQLVSGAIVVQAQTVGSSHSFLSSHGLFIGTWWDNRFSASFPTQCVWAGAEEQSKAVLLWHTLQEAPQGFVAFLAVTAVVRDACSLGASHNIFWSEGATFLIQSTVLGCFETLVLAIHRERGSWEIVQQSLEWK